MANMLAALRSLYGSWDWVLEDLCCSGHLEDIQNLQEDDVAVWVFARRKHTCICVRPRNPSKRGSKWALPHLERDPKGTEKRVDVWSCRAISKSQPSLTCIIVLGHCWIGILLLLAHHSRGAKGLKPQMMMSSQGDEDISKLKVDVGLGMLMEGVKSKNPFTEFAPHHQKNTYHIFSLTALLKKTRSQKCGRGCSQDSPAWGYGKFCALYAWCFLAILHVSWTRFFLLVGRDHALWTIPTRCTCELQVHHWQSDLNSKCGRQRSFPRTTNPVG